MERKKSIDMHTNIATSLLDQIKVGKVIVNKKEVLIYLSLFGFTFLGKETGCLL